MNAAEWRSDDPFDFTASVGRYSRWGDDPVNVATADSFYRIAGDGMPYRASPGADETVLIETAGNPDIALADLDHRFAQGLPRHEVATLAKRVPAIEARLTASPGYRPPMTLDPFEALVTSITAQQVNLRWALTTRRRLVERFGRLADFDGVPVWEFPSPERLASADPSELRAMQFTTRKAEYVVELARAALDGTLDDLGAMSSEAVIERVTEIRGIGRWSAEWLLARCLARPDAVAAGDLGVRKAVSRFVVGADEVISEEDVRAVVEGWGDGANWGVHLLLEALAG